METIPIQSLNPQTSPPNDASIRAVVTLSWPFSSSTRQCALLLSDPDFRLRSKQGQVRVRFTGPSAEAVARSHIGIGDTVLLSLGGATWAQDVNSVRTPGRSVDGELVYDRKLELLAARFDGEVKISVDEPTPVASPERSHVSPTSTPMRRDVSQLRSSLNGAVNSIPVYSSPAFIKRLRLSGQAFPTLSHDLLQDDELGREPANKKQRVSFDRTGQWRYTERSPSPVKEAVVTADDDGMHEPGPRATVANVAANQMSNQQETNAIPSVPEESIMTPKDVQDAIISTTMLPPPLPRLHVPEAQPIKGPQEDVTIGEVPDEGPSTPKLQPVPSSGLPLPSPFPVTPGEHRPSTLEAALASSSGAQLSESQPGEDMAEAGVIADDEDGQPGDANAIGTRSLAEQIDTLEETPHSIPDDAEMHDRDSEEGDESDGMLHESDAEEVIELSDDGSPPPDSEDEHKETTEVLYQPAGPDSSSLPGEKPDDPAHVAEAHDLDDGFASQPQTPEKVRLEASRATGNSNKASTPTKPTPQSEKDRVMAKTFQSLFGFNAGPDSTPTVTEQATPTRASKRKRLHVSFGLDHGFGLDGSNEIASGRAQYADGLVDATEPPLPPSVSNDRPDAGLRLSTMAGEPAAAAASSTPQIEDSVEHQADADSTVGHALPASSAPPSEVLTVAHGEADAVLEARDPLPKPGQPVDQRDASHRTADVDTEEDSADGTRDQPQDEVHIEPDESRDYSPSRQSEADPIEPGSIFGYRVVQVTPSETASYSPPASHDYERSASPPITAAASGSIATAAMLPGTSVQTHDIHDLMEIEPASETQGSSRSSQVPSYPAEAVVTSTANHQVVIEDSQADLVEGALSTKTSPTASPDRTHRANDESHDKGSYLETAAQRDDSVSLEDDMKVELHESGSPNPATAAAEVIELASSSPVLEAEVSETQGVGDPDALDGRLEDTDAKESPAVTILADVAPEDVTNIVEDSMSMVYGFSQDEPAGGGVSYPALPISPFDSQQQQGTLDSSLMEVERTATTTSILPPTPQLTQHESDLLLLPHKHDSEQSQRDMQPFLDASQDQTDDIVIDHTISQEQPSSNKSPSLIHAPAPEISFLEKAELDTSIMVDEASPLRSSNELNAMSQTDDDSALDNQAGVVSQTERETMLQSEHAVMSETEAAAMLESEPKNLAETEPVDMSEAEPVPTLESELADITGSEPSVLAPSETAAAAASGSTTKTELGPPVEPSGGPVEETDPEASARPQLDPLVMPDVAFPDTPTADALAMKGSEMPPATELEGAAASAVEAPSLLNGDLQDATNGQVLEEAHRPVHAFPSTPAQAAAHRFEATQPHQEMESSIDVSMAKTVSSTSKKTPARKSLRHRLSNVPDVISAWFSPKRSSTARLGESEGGDDAATGSSPLKPPKRAKANGQAHATIEESVSGQREVESLSESRPNGLLTEMSYFTPLVRLEEKLNASSQQVFGSNTVDVFAIVTKETKEPQRAESGPRDYFTTFRIRDMSISADDEGGYRQVDVFRPWKATLPVAAVGDVVLLRAFVVKSRNRKPYLLSTDASAWCVWRYGDETDVAEENEDGGEHGRARRSSALEVREEIKGPPVELGEAERKHAAVLRAHWVASVQ